MKQSEPNLNSISHDDRMLATCTWDNVSSVCLEFQNAWENANPRLEEYLDRVAVDDRRPLVRNLLDVDIAARRRRGESPAAGDYLGRLPGEYGDLVREAFLEASTWNRPATKGLREDGSLGGVVALGATRLGEYRLVRELGRGGMGAVFEAVHAVRGHRVALKTLPTASGDALHRFKREFRTLADVTHPNLVGLHTLESDGSQWFITLDLLEGVDFLQHVRPRNELELPRLRHAFAQLCTGVMALHARGVVHRDLKPSNVMVTHDGRVVILDFGLAAELDRAGVMALSQSVAGTPAYMAPEQVSTGTIGPPADWYAVGVMLYEALCGVRPFGGSLMQIMQNKCAREAPPLPRADEHPHELVTLCHGLLARPPASRPDPAQIAAVCSMSEARVSPTEQHSNSLVGRDSQRQSLSHAFSDFIFSKQPVCAFIQGRSGEGKTCLAESFLEPLRRDTSLVVMSGRCYDRESVPFKALDTFVDALESHLRSLPDTDAALLLPDDISMLVELFPVLRRCDVIARAPRARIDALDQQQVRQRGFAALRLLLDRIGANTPLVCFIDDLHWGDADSAAALMEVLRPPAAPRIFFLGSFRSDEADSSPFLQEWLQRTRQHGIDRQDRDISVGPLELEDAVQLVVQLLDRDDEIVRRRAVQFHAQSGGNPFLLTELVGCFDPDTDAFQASDIYGVLDKKLAALPPEAAPLLEAVAVSGQSVALAEAADAAALHERPEGVLTRLRNSRLLRIVGEKVDTYHDRIRHVVLDRLPNHTRQAIHHRLAQSIERTAGGFSDDQLNTVAQRAECNGLPALPRIYDLSYHYLCIRQVSSAKNAEEWCGIAC